MLGGETQDRWVGQMKLCPVHIYHVIFTMDSVPWLPCAVMNDELVTE